LQNFKQYFEETPDVVKFKDGTRLAWGADGAMGFGILGNILLYKPKSTHGGLATRIGRYMAKEEDFNNFIASEAKTPNTTGEERMAFVTLGEPQFTDRYKGVWQREDFDVAGRFWPNEKVISFWQTFKQVEPYMVLIVKFLESIEAEPVNLKYEFIDSDKQFNWSELGLDNIPSGMRRSTSEIAQAQAAQHVASPLEKEPVSGSKPRPLRRGKMIPRAGIQLSPGGRPVIGDSVETFKTYVEGATANIVSFDFDNTIAKTQMTPNGKYDKDANGNLIVTGIKRDIEKIMREYNAKGYKVLIVTARPEKDRWQVEEFVEKYNLPVSKIYCTSFRPKKYLLNKIPVEAHYDDSLKEIDGLKSIGVNAILVKEAQANKKIVYIARGLPGSGKSYTMAKTVPSTNIFSTDEFWGPEYNYKPALAGRAHKWNQNRTAKAMSSGISPIGVDNTNIKWDQIKPYAQMAKDYGYTVKYLEATSPWWKVISDQLKKPEFKEGNPHFEEAAEFLNNRNVHGVPLEVIKMMMTQWQPTETLPK